MDRSFSMEFALEIDFEKVQEVAGETSRFSQNVLSTNSLFYLVSSILLQKKTVVIQITKVIVKVIKVRKNKCSPKKKVEKKNTKWSTSKPKSKFKKRSTCVVVKGTRGPRLDVYIVKIELDAFFLFINEGIVSQILQRADDEERM